MLLSPRTNSHEAGSGVAMARTIEQSPRGRISVRPTDVPDVRALASCCANFQRRGGPRRSALLLEHPSYARRQPRQQRTRVPFLEEPMAGVLIQLQVFAQRLDNRAHLV